jgi:hypothetical protein
VKPIMIQIICACSWSGTVTGRQQCPGCGAAHTSRVSKQRVAKLREIARARVTLGARPVVIEPAMCRWLLAGPHRLIEADGPSPTPSDVRRYRRPVRAYRLTELGRAVLSADGAVELRRAIAVDTAVRHSAL